MSAVDSMCPSWCPNVHAEALSEGCDPETAAVHQGPDYSSRGVNPRSGLDMVLTAQPGSNGWPERPLVEVLARQGDQDGNYQSVTVSLTTGDVRRVAAQLLHLADLADLHD